MVGGGGGNWRITSYIMVFRGYRGGGEGQSTPTEYKEGTIRIDFLLTAKEGGLRKNIYVIYQTGGPYWEKLCTVGHSFPQYGPTLAGE